MANSAPHSVLTRCLPWLALGGLLLWCAVLYWPGLASLLLFDDLPNLGALEHIRDAGPGSEGFWEFVFSGQAGPTGRPLALFSFALQAAHWPQDPGAFKAVNLAIHLLNAALVFALMQVLVRLAKVPQAARVYVAGLTTALWVLHPAHTATVLYTVQRMTLLSSTFMLAALLGYLKLRIRYFGNWRSPGFWAALVGCALLAVLGILAKENAVSVLFYLLTLEFTLLARVRSNQVLRLVPYCLWLAVAAGGLAWLWYYQDIQAAFAARYPFGPWERLLTEGRILWFHVSNIVLPGPSATALFHEFVPSSGVRQPGTTAFAWGLWMAVIFLALGYRRQQPVLAFAVLWFWSGHLIESTVLPLELYFNHRNYLAMLGPLLLLVWAGYQVALQLAGRVNPRLLQVVPLLLLVGLSSQLALTSRLWHTPVELAYAWYSADPQATRNEQFLANQLAAQGALEPAMEVYTHILAGNPLQLRPYLAYLTLSCYVAAAEPVDFTALEQAMHTAGVAQNDVLTPLRQLNAAVQSGQCLSAGSFSMEQLLLDVQPNLGDEERGFVQYELAQLYLHQNRTEAALQLMEQAWLLTRDPGILYNQADLLIQQGDSTRALALVALGLQQLEVNNRIATGTRADKRQAFASMQAYLLAPGP